LSRRGLGFASASLRTTQSVLDAISVTAQSITLSGTRGNIPITIVNDTQRTLNVVVEVTSSGGLRVDGPKSIPMTLRPQETYLEVPVDLQASLSGKLTVDVTAGGVSLARKVSTVSSSYLDRVAVGGLALTLLVGLLVFIARRGRAGGGTDRTNDRRERYTDEDGDVVPSER
jgi:hypothetical protein